MAEEFEDADEVAGADDAREAAAQAEAAAEAEAEAWAVAQAEAEAKAKAEAGSAEPPPPGAQDIGVLDDIELEATLQFGSAEMPLGELLELGPGDVVELNRHVSEPIDLVVGDRIVARGEVVVASGNFALRITEVATPQLRLESIRCLF